MDMLRDRIFIQFVSLSVTMNILTNRFAKSNPLLKRLLIEEREFGN